MTNPNPITPPPELVRQWRIDAPNARDAGATREAWIATQAARWGADAELEACVGWMAGEYLENQSRRLRAARRPRPQPSLKEQALAALDSMAIEPCFVNGVDANASVRAKYNTIRRALEQLP